jgi:Leucine-rich repeat (LRR) protein
MGQLSSLLLLDLSHNLLTGLPPQMGQLSSLETLYLSHNQLTSLPPEIGLLSSLRELQLVHNQLTSLPIEMANLSSLIWLFLNDNCIVYLPSMSLNAKIIHGNNQRLPTVLEATTFLLHSDGDTDADRVTEDDNNPSEFYLYFSDNEPPRQRSSLVPIAHRRALAKRWPYFRHLLDAGLSEAHSGHVDLSAYFSLRLGQCLVDYFEERPIQVSSLTLQDNQDFIADADYVGVTDTLLFHFCTTALKKSNPKKRKRQ